MPKVERSKKASVKKDEVSQKGKGGKNSKEGQGKRIYWLDVLRVLSILAVVTIHASVQNWEVIRAGSPENAVLAVFDATSRFAVPVFVMISGALMLRRELTFKKCLLKVGRLAIVWVFWCVFYSVMALILGKGPEAALQDLAFGHFHMWFLPMIAALYLLTPALKWVTRDQRRCVVAIIILLVISASLEFRWTAYPMYYLMGYVLGSGNWVRGKKKNVAIALSIVLYLTAVTAIAVLNYKESVAAGAAIHPKDGDWSIFAMMQAVAVFIGVKLMAQGQKEQGKKTKVLARLAGDVLGVYLAHIAVMGLLNRIGISDVMFGGVVGTIAGTVITIVLTAAGSVALIEVMRRVPGLRRVV